MVRAGEMAFNRAMAVAVRQLGPLAHGEHLARVLRFHDVAARPGRTVATHAHAWLELSVVRSGAVIYAADGRERVVRAGGAFAMPPGGRHAWRAAGPAVISGFQVLLAPASGGSHAAQARWAERVIDGRWTLPPHPLARALIDELHAAGSPELRCQLLRALLAWLLERLEIRDAARPSARGDDDAERLARLRAYVLEHLGDRLPLAELARRSGLSARHLNRLFAAAHGRPLRRFITEERLARMAQALISRDEPIAVLAREVGYDDAAYLGRLFRRRYGATPDAWRRRRR